MQNNVHPQNYHDQQNTFTIKMTAPPGKCLIGMYIYPQYKPKHIQEQEIKPIRVHSISFLIGMDICIKYGIMIPPDGVIKVNIKTDDDGLFSNLTEIDPQILEKPSVDGLEGLVGLVWVPSLAIVNLWVKHGKKLEWEITKEEVDEFFDEELARTKKEIEEFVKKQQRNLPPQGSNGKGLILP